MNIEYFETVSRAWDRMITALFRPFDLGKWLALGFTVFLAGLLDGHMGSSADIIYLSGIQP
jgi:hypothetical protein